MGAGRSQDARYSAPEAASAKEESMSAFRILVLLLAAATIAFAAGCGGDDDDEETAATEEAAGGGQTVSMSEFEFDPNDLTASQGDTITAENAGQIVHNLTIVEGNDPENPGSELATTEDVQPGDSGEVTVDVDAGNYSIICTVPGHAEDGMVGTIAVE
jgi:plastocyanin